MANLGESFNADDLPIGNSGEYELLPEGLYSAMISKAEVAQTKSGTGTKIDCRFDITGPSHQGRRSKAGWWRSRTRAASWSP